MQFLHCSYSKLTFAFRVRKHISFKARTVLIGQRLLRTSISARCIGVVDETGLVLNVTKYEKRIEDMVSEARGIMPLFVALHLD